MEKLDPTRLLLLAILIEVRACAAMSVASPSSAKDVVLASPSLNGLSSHPDPDSVFDAGNTAIDYDYDNEEYEDDQVVGNQGHLIPPSHQGFERKTTVKPAQPKGVRSGHRQTTCAYDDSRKQYWKKTKGGKWRRKRKNRKKRWRRRLLDEHVLCNGSCMIVLEMDKLKNHTSAKIVRQGCYARHCNVSECDKNLTTKGGDKQVFFCCCRGDQCNAGEVFLPQLNTLVQNQDTAPGHKNDSSEGRRRSFAPTPTTIRPGGSAFLCAFREPEQKNPDSSHESKVSGYSVTDIHLNKRYPSYMGDEDHHSIGFPSQGRRGNVTVGQVQINKTTILCQPKSFCFTAWTSDRRNKSKMSIEMQGCWLSADENRCTSEVCESTLPPGQKDVHVCCCSGHMCNAHFKDVYDPLTTTTLTTISQPAPEAIEPIHDHSYREKTIIVALVLLLSVSLMIVFGYLACRLCLTRKRATPLNSSASTRTDIDLADGGLGPPPPQFNMEDLKILDLIVRGRYSEVRRGTLNGKDVAVKIYQHHHRQYFFNERSAFSLPFMENENLVKFYGAAERTVETADGGHTPELALGLEGGGICVSQYLIVTELAPLGSLTSYLKHNTVDWYQLCRMCQGICAGLVHLHTDITRGDLGLFKHAVAHRDVNTRNILVKSDLTCVLADLGFSVGIMGSKIIRNGIAEIAEQCSLADVGTLRYMAPEVFDGAVNLRDCEASLKQIDMYALGLVMWEVASRCVDLYQGAPMPDYQLPFQAEAGSHPLFEELQVLVVKYNTRPKFPEVWKDTHPAVRYLKETIQDCWDSDADARLSALCVQERIADMATLWVQGSNRKRDVMPTLNTDLWPDMNRAPNKKSIPGVVSNGVSVLPSFVDDDFAGIYRSSGNFHDTGGRDGMRNSEEEIMRALNSTATKSATNIFDPAHLEEVDDDIAVTAPLIDSNLSQLTVRDNEESSSDDKKRVREWLREQSMSESTMDTLLPLTPLSDRNQNLMDCSINDRFHCQPGPSISGAVPQVAVKANNVMLAQRKGVISHPNQGRNPTVERNTHKCSDEELAVQGNQLVGTLDSRSSGGSETLGPLAKRKGSLDTHSAPQVTRDNPGGGNSEGELSSLVQHDLLNESHAEQHHYPARNTPIPFLQNQVHQGGTQSGMMRPKLANITGGTNRCSNSHPVRDSEGNHGDRRGFSMSYPQCGLTTSAVSASTDTKSIKHKLSKFIRPKDLGHKFTNLIFGGKKKSFDVETPSKRDMSEASADSAFQLRGFQAGRDNPTQTQCHYDNSGLERSPQNRKSGSEGPTVPMQVKLSNGAVVSSTCRSNISLPAAPISVQAACNRLPNTDVRQGGFQESQFKSPTLFANHLGCRDDEISFSSIRNDSSSSNDKVKFNHNNALVQDLESLSLPIHDQNHNTHNHSTTASDFLNANHLSSCCVTTSKQDVPRRYKYNKSDTGELVSQQADAPPSLSESLSVNQHQSVNSGPRAQVAPDRSVLYSLPDTKGGNLIMYTADTESSSVLGKASLASQVPQTSHAIHSDLASDSAVTIASRKELPVMNDSVDRCSLWKLAPDKLPVQIREAQSGESCNTSEPGHSRLGMSYSWHEEGIGMSNSNPHFCRRPKSLSLHGHNYEKKKAQRKSTPGNHSKFSGEVLEDKRTNMTCLTNSTNSHTCESKIDKERNKLMSINDGSGSVLSAQAMVAPNVTIDSTICHPDSCGDQDVEKPLVPSVRPLHNRCNVEPISLPLSRDNSQSFRPIKSPVEFPCGQGIPALSSLCTQNHLASGDTSFQDCFESKSNLKNLEHQKVIVGDTDMKETRREVPKQRDAKLRRVGSASSDSSEKIRRRIKTPVSFKNGRLSLYDDRLMSQSLDSSVLYSMSGDEV